MPYQYILANLLAEVESALGVLFVDEEGERVDLAARDREDLDLEITAAYLGIYLKRVVSLTMACKLGSPRVLLIERPGMTLLCSALSGGYCLGLVLRSPVGLGRATRSLLRAAADMEREVLAEID
jgi:hypothetical protein